MDVTETAEAAFFFFFFLSHCAAHLYGSGMATFQTEGLYLCLSITNAGANFSQQPLSHFPMEGYKGDLGSQHKEGSKARENWGSHAVRY